MTTRKDPAHIFGHLGTAADGSPLVLIPRPDRLADTRDDCHGIEPGWHDVVALLREHAASPDAIRFIADMIEA
jgi:hypothetical protein